MLNKILLRMLLLSLSLTANAWPGTVVLQPVGDATTWPDSPFRWLDVADFLYASDYRDNFAYNQPTVMISFCDTSKMLRSTLIAS